MATLFIAVTCAVYLEIKFYIESFSNFLVIFLCAHVQIFILNLYEFYFRKFLKWLAVSHISFQAFKNKMGVNVFNIF